jgi:hypothetical protein
MRPRRTSSRQGIQLATRARWPVLRGPAGLHAGTRGRERHLEEAANAACTRKIIQGGCFGDPGCTRRMNVAVIGNPLARRQPEPRRLVRSPWLINIHEMTTSPGRHFNNPVGRQENDNGIDRMPIGREGVGHVIHWRKCQQRDSQEDCDSLLFPGEDCSGPSQDRNQNPGRRIGDVPELKGTAQASLKERERIAGDKLSRFQEFLVHEAQFPKLRVIAGIVIGEIAVVIDRALHPWPVSRPQLHPEVIADRDQPA